MYIAIREIDAQCKSMHEAGRSELVLWDNPGGWDGEGSGRGFGSGGHLCAVADSCRCVAKPTTILYRN